MITRKERPALRLRRRFDPQPVKRQRQFKPERLIHRFECVGQMVEILVRTVRRKPLSVDLGIPPVAELPGIGTGEVLKLLITDDRDEILDGFLAWILPAANLILSFAPCLVDRDCPELLQGISDSKAGLDPRRRGARSRW